MSTEHPRTILHVDLDAFYSSIEQRDRPELRGKPVVVGGDPAQRGVVATASYEARRYGIHSAMPASTARRLCPHAVFVAPRFDAYRQVSRTVMEILRTASPVLEPIALDEAFLDASDAVRPCDGWEELGLRVKAEIHRETGLTASVGVATNRITAKVASDFRKPDGLTLVLPGTERQFLGPLPVRKLWGIGPRAEQRLSSAGIETAAQLAGADEGWLVARFGTRGLEWQRLARGIDDRPVGLPAERRQVSRELTFARDVSDPAALYAEIGKLAALLGADLQGRPPGRTVTLKLRYADFQTLTRRLTPGGGIAPESLETLGRVLFDQNWNRQPVRLLGLGVSNFFEVQPGQLTFLEDGQ